MKAPLRAVLARRVHPARVQGVHADPVAHQLEGDAARQRRERALGGRIGGDEGLAGVARHGADVDHGAGRALAAHDLGGLLHEEEGRAQVDREHPVEKLRRGVQDGAAVGQGGAVDQAVEFSEGRVGLGDHRPAILDVFQIRLDEMGRAAGRAQVAGDLFAAFGVAPADHQAGGAAFGEEPRRRLAQTLRAAGDHGVFAGHLAGRLARRCHACLPLRYSVISIFAASKAARRCRKPILA